MPGLSVSGSMYIYIYIYIKIAYDSYDANKHQVFILKTHRQRLCFQCAVVNVAAFSAVMYASVKGPPFHCQKAHESAGRAFLISSNLPWFQCDWVTVRSTELFVFLVSGCVGGNCFNCLWCAKWKCNFQWGKKDQDEVVPKIVLKWFTCVFGIETLFCSLFFLVYRSVFVSINTYYVVFTNKYKDQRQWVHVWDHIYKDKYRILSI